jgi:hypothetical protein
MIPPEGGWAGSAGPLLVDAHVHFHPGYQAGTFLDAAAANIARVAAALPDASGAAGCLLLVDPGAGDALAGFRGGADGWRIEALADPGALLALRPAAPPLLLVAGRQIATRERLEVLALCTTDRFAGGLGLEETITAVQRAGALPVLPWGFGKWTLRRGRRVARAFRGAGRPLFAGDNGGRAALLPCPRLLRTAASLGVPILPGSDPLPFAGGQSRPGHCGFVAPLPLDPAEPALRLRAWLHALDGQPRVFGQGERLDRFAWNQLRMQLRRRLRS